MPRWRGTGYYYSRFRPGLGVSTESRGFNWSLTRFQTVLVFLTIVTAALQYLVQRINYQKDLKRIDEVVGQARSAAWGNKLTPVEGQQRKVRSCRDSTVWTPPSSHTDTAGQGEPGRACARRRRWQRRTGTNGRYGRRGQQCVYCECSRVTARKVLLITCGG